MRSERDKMLAGELYDPLDPELVRARERARDLCQDLNAVYSFHPGGANAVFADGSVRFLKADIEIRVLAALVTRAGGEVPCASDY